MSVELSQLIQLVVGQRRFLTIGDLPTGVRLHFGCNPGVIYLRREEALHIFNGHSDVRAEDVMLLGLVVAGGRYYQDPKRSNCTTVVWRNPDTGKPLQAGLKLVGSGEVWVATFHHTNEAKIRQRYKRWPLICSEATEKGAGGRPG